MWEIEADQLVAEYVKVKRKCDAKALRQMEECAKHDFCTSCPFMHKHTQECILASRYHRVAEELDGIKKALLDLRPLQYLQPGVPVVGALNSDIRILLVAANSEEAREIMQELHLANHSVYYDRASRNCKRLYLNHDIIDYPYTLNKYNDDTIYDQLMIYNTGTPIDPKRLEAARRSVKLWSRLPEEDHEIIIERNV